jgi:hypothetical protein
LLAAEPTDEMAPVEELRVRVHGDATAIVTGKSPIMNMVEKRNYDQATRLPDTAK